MKERSPTMTLSRRMRHTLVEVAPLSGPLPGDREAGDMETHPSTSYVLFPKQAIVLSDYGCRFECSNVPLL